MANILIVEDEPAVSDNIKIILSSQNHNCYTAFNGIEALTQLKSRQVDLILSDIMMPEMDGISLYKKIVDEGIYWNIPFIFLTAKANDADLREAMNLGAEDYIHKPFKMNELINVVDVRLKKQRNELKRISQIRENISKYVPHELRTPIGIILGYSDLILHEEELEREDILNMVGLIEKSGIRLKDRIEKLIFLTEIELDIDEGKHKTSSIGINDGLIFDLSIKSIGYFNRAKDFRVNIEHSTLDIPLHYLEVVVHEIIDNSCKFSDEGSAVSIAGKIDGEFYKLIFTDRGIGMDTEEINNLYAFVQISRDQKQQEGNGLGIILVKRILDFIGGKFEIESIKNKETTVSILIPITK